MLLERDSGYGARPGLHRPLCLHTESPESPYSRSLPSGTLDGNFATQVRRDWRENYLRGHSTAPPPRRSGRRRAAAEADSHGSGSTGSDALFTRDGSSRSFMNKSVPFGRGTVNVVSTKPTGSETLCANCESEATESIRKRFCPIKLQGLSGLSGQ